MSTPVDVRALMDSVERSMFGAGSSVMRERVREGRVAVAELIEADKEYDAALAHFTKVNREIAESGWVALEHSTLREAGMRFVAADSKRQSALARCGGAK